MEFHISQQDRAKVIEVLDTSPRLARTLVALVEATQGNNLDEKSQVLLARILELLPATDTAPNYQMVTHGGYPGVAAQATLRGQRFETLLSEGSFNKSRSEQDQFARDLGYRLSTREENRANAQALLDQERAGSITPAGEHALETYRLRHVRDTAGVLTINRCDIIADHYTYPGAYSNAGFLFVRMVAQLERSLSSSPLV